MATMSPPLLLLRRGRTTTRTCRRLLRSIVVAVVVAAATLAVLSDGVPLVAELKRDAADEPPQPGKNVCYSKGCVHAAASILRHLDADVDPCDDFYGFVCGGKRSLHLIDDEAPDVRISFNDVRAVVQKRWKAMLTERDDDGDAEATTKARTFYRSCLNTDAIEREGTKPLLDLLTSLGPWPFQRRPTSDNGTIADEEERDWTSVAAQLIRAGFSQATGVHVAAWPNDDGSGADQIRIHAAFLDFYGADDWSSRIVQRHYAKMVNISEEMGWRGGGGADLEADLRQVVEVILNLSISYERVVDNDMVEVDLDDLYNITDKIDWRRYLSDVLGRDAGEIDGKFVKVRPASLAALVDAITALPNRVVLNYLFWGVVLESDKEKLLPERLSGAAKPSFDTREDVCRSRTERFFNQALIAAYVDRFVPSETKEKVGEMFDSLRDAAVSAAAKIDYLDDGTLAVALRRFSTLRSLVFYPDEIRDGSHVDRHYENFTVDESDPFLRTHWRVSRQIAMEKFDAVGEIPTTKSVEWTDVNVRSGSSYMIQKHVITIGMTESDPFFFSADRPDYVNLGRIGSIVAHELSHILSGLGGFDHRMTGDSEWWGTNSTEAFLEKAGCLIDQYGQIRPVSRRDPRRPFDPVNGETTLEENLADNVGYRLAFEVYKGRRGNVSASAEDDLLLLPGMTAFTRDQLFWISVGSVWCSAVSDAAMAHALRRDSHTPPEYRLNAAVRNSPQFAASFACPPDSPMNPDEKCFVW